MKLMRIGLRRSINEEATAASRYRARAKIARREGDDATARLYEHVAREEDTHFREFRARLSKV